MMRIDDAVPVELLAAVFHVNEFIQHIEDNPHQMDRAPTIYRRMVKHLPLVAHGGFYTTRLLTKEGADYFLAAADRMKDYFEPNSEEELDYQIPEVVLKYHACTMEEHILGAEIAEKVLWPLFHLMYGNSPNTISSLQLARYSYPTNKGTGWHCDVDSEATCVVSLAPERHEGGGTLLMPSGVLGDVHKLDPLPKGHALLFDGRHVLHRGLEVIGGERNLLVYWMKHCELAVAP